MWQQYWVLRNLFSGLSIYSSPLVSAEVCVGGGGQEIDSKRNTYRLSQLGSQLPAKPAYF
jgi:hypothetical protein